MFSMLKNSGLVTMFQRLPSALADGQDKLPLKWALATLKFID